MPHRGSVLRHTSCGPVGRVKFEVIESGSGSIRIRPAAPVVLPSLGQQLVLQSAQLRQLPHQSLPPPLPSLGYQLPPYQRAG